MNDCPRQNPAYRPTLSLFLFGQCQRNNHWGVVADYFNWGVNWDLSGDLSWRLSPDPAGPNQKAANQPSNWEIQAV